MKKVQKRILLTFVLFAFLVVFYVLYSWISYPLLHVQYNGKITKFHFDAKGYSEFQIDNQETWYQMHYLGCDLKLGDLMRKKMDDMYIYHFKNNKIIGKYSAILGYRYDW